MPDALPALRPVAKPEHYRDLGPVDIAPIVNLVERLGEDAWAAADEYKDNKFAVLGVTQHLVFRFPVGNIDPRACTEYPAWDVWKPLLMPLMDQLIAQYGHAEPAISKVMLARMPPGGVIDPHKDGYGSNALSHKCHVPILTNPDVHFFVKGETRHLAAGQGYEVNNIVVHGAVNHGDTHRIHLIFEHFDAAGLVADDPALSTHDNG